MAKLSPLTKLGYGLGSVAFGVKDAGFNAFLILFYNQVMGMPASLVGGAVLLALVIDAFVDPLIGQWSDNLRTRWGRRHPLMYASALPVAVSYGLLWNPPRGLAPAALFFYLVATAVVVRSFIALYEIPSAALLPELSRDYDERTSAASYRGLCNFLGGYGMTVVTYLFLLRPTTRYPVGQLNPAGYSAYGLVASLVMLTSILLSALATHHRIPSFHQPPDRSNGGLSQVVREMRLTLSNRSFASLLAAGIFFSVGGGLAAGLKIYFDTYFWELRSAQIAMVALAGAVGAILAMRAAPAIGGRLGKKPSAIVLLLLGLFFYVLPIVLRLLGLFPENSSPLLVPLLFLCLAAAAATGISSAILMTSMISDVVEDNEIRTGRRSEGLLFSTSSFIQKAVSGTGLFMSGVILTAVNFPQSGSQRAVPHSAAVHLAWAYLPVLTVCYVVAMGFVGTYKLTRETHELNLARLRQAQD